MVPLGFRVSIKKRRGRPLLEKSKIQNASAEGRNLAIEARDLSYRFSGGNRDVLRQLNFAVENGSFIMMTGPSGAGKTTVLSLMGGLRRPQRGALRVLDNNMNDLNDLQMQSLRRRIGFIFQDHYLLSALTAEATLRMTMDLWPDRYSAEDYKERPIAILSSLGLGDRARARPKDLSTGERQRVAIARALINDPDLILADEPTAALDPDRTDEIISMLANQVREKGRTIVMITHENRLFSYADFVLEMAEGRFLST